ncbi:MAG TPA: hypothetical protein VG963_20080 [Polyangiaceae bacterium]|nr:hypothetical protein [Polyangiaceae bacterium]
MLGRYRIVRGARGSDDPLPEGVRQDTRKHTRHVLRPSAEMVAAFFEQPGEAGFRRFRSTYLKLLQERFRSQRAEFDALAELAQQRDVFLGCNCPTAKQPDVHHCHTYLALGFLAEHYPGLNVSWP